MGTGCTSGREPCIYEMALLYRSVSLSFTFSEINHDLALLSNTYLAVG